MRALVALLSCVLVSACSALRPRELTRQVVRGPLPTRIQHPLALEFPHLSLRRAIAQGAGEVGVGASFTYSSIYESVDRDGYDARFDGELARATARVRVGLGGGWDLEGEFAVLHAGGGFLDEFLGAYHELLGLPNQGRDDAADDEVEMHVAFEGRELYALEPNQVLLQDLPLVLTWADAEPRADAWSRAWRVALELPLGSERDGAGNGEWDWGLGLCAERSWGRWTHFASASLACVRTPAGFDGSPIDVSELLELAYGLELRFSDSLSLLAQLDALSPLTDDVPYEELDAPMVDLGLGLVRDLAARSRFYVSFHEDVVSASGPDIALSCGWSWNL